VSALLGLFAMVFVYAVEDRFMVATLSRAATEMQLRHQASGLWPTPPQAFMQRHDTAASLPDDLRRPGRPSRTDANSPARRVATTTCIGWAARVARRPTRPCPTPAIPCWWPRSAGCWWCGLSPRVAGLVGGRQRRPDTGCAGAGRMAGAAHQRATGAPGRRHGAQPTRGRFHRATPYALENRDDEVGLLARHLDALTARTQSFIEREQVFTRDVSHELRTPLAVLGMASERLLGRNDLPADVAAELQHMRQVLWDLEQTVNTLLALAREARAPAVSAAMADGASARVG
jgi:hypothetical protein